MRTRISLYDESMALNIRNEEVEKLAAELAKLTGESKTEAVRNALKESLSVLHRRGRRGKASVEELLAIATRAAAYVKRPYLDHAELLYDEHGLPK
jgi:antitoxin VapB